MHHVNAAPRRRRVLHNCSAPRQSDRCHITRPLDARVRPRAAALLLSHLRRDLVAGVTVGLVALPLAMAFAIASGMTPQAGIYCAIVTGFLISALGGSRCQIGGPTGAFVVVVAGIVAEHGVDGLFMCTMMAGVMLVVLGAHRHGHRGQFIPRPVVIGFTNGIAVLIASTQIKDFFGLQHRGACPASSSRAWRRWRGTPARIVADGDAARRRRRWR